MKHRNSLPYWFIITTLLFIFLFPSVLLAGTLHGPTEEGDLSKVKQLLNEGADVNLKLTGGWTPLHRAVESDKVDVAKLLIAKGADVNARLDSGETPLDLAVRHLGSSDIPVLLLKHGANTNITSNPQNTLLHIAVRTGDLGVVEFLLNNGGDPNATYDDSWTLRQRALDEGYTDIADLLKGKGGNIGQKRVVMTDKRPRVLFRQHEQKPQLAARGYLFLYNLKDQLSKLSDSIEPPILLKKGCQLTIKEEINDELVWKRDPQRFDFVVTSSTHYSESITLGDLPFDAPEIEAQEEWEIYKVSNPTLSQKTSKIYIIEVPSTSTNFYDQDAAEAIQTMIAPIRGRIIKDFCSFIKQHFNPEGSLRTE